jgi:MFS family permease
MNPNLAKAPTHPSRPTPSRPADTGWMVVVLCGIAAGTHIWKLPAALDQVRADMGIDLVQAGVLVGLVQVASLLGGLLVAWCGDFLGLRRLVGFGLVMLAVGSIAGALAPGAAALMAARAVEGVGFLLCTVLGPPLIRRTCRPDRLNSAMAGWGAFQGSATLLGMVATALALQAIEWRLWWVLMAVAALAPLPLLRRVVPADRLPDGPRRKGMLAAARAIGATVRSVRPWLAGGVFASYTIQWMAVLGFLPTIFRDAGMPGPWPGLMAGLVGGINALGALAAGRLLDRGHRPGTLLVGSLAAMAITAFAAFGVPWGTGTAGLSALLASALAFSLIGGLVPAVITRLTVDVVPAGGSMTAAMGLMQQIFNVGNFAGPPLLAWLATLAGGWHAIWWLAAAFGTLGSLLSWVLTRTGRRTPTPAIADPTKRPDPFTRS